MSLARAQTQTARFGDERANYEATTPPTPYSRVVIIFGTLLRNFTSCLLEPLFTGPLLCGLSNSISSLGSNQMPICSL